MSATLTIQASGTEPVILNYATDVDAMEMVVKLLKEGTGSARVWIKSSLDNRMVWVPQGAVVVADFAGDLPETGDGPFVPDRVR